LLRQYSRPFVLITNLFMVVTLLKKTFLHPVDYGLNDVLFWRETYSQLIRVAIQPVLSNASSDISFVDTRAHVYFDNQQEMPEHVLRQFGATLQFYGARQGQHKIFCQQ